MAFLFPQPLSQSSEQEQYGFQAIYASRTFDTVQTVTNQGLLNYSHTTGFGTQIIVSIGVNDLLIPNSATGVSKFKSSFTTTYRIGIKQYFGALYIGGGFWYYSADGDIKTERPDSITYSFQNVYSFYEVPFQIGYDLVLDRLAFTLGVTTSWLYGKNEKTLTVIHRDYSMDFGRLSTDFISQLPVGVVAGISFPISSEFSLQVTSNWYSTKGFSASLVLWAAAK
jgi:hypothetical protein